MVEVHFATSQKRRTPSTGAAGCVLVGADVDADDALGPVALDPAGQQVAFISRSTG